MRDFQLLRSFLLKNYKGVYPGMLILITSLDGQSSSLISANLSLSFAYGGKKTILVDADLRKPSLHRFFKTSNTKGFSEFIKNPPKIDQYLQDTNELNLKFMSSGKSLAYPSDAIAKADLKQISSSLKEKAEIIVLNTSCLREGAEVLSLLEMSDQKLVVVELGKARITQAEEIRKFLVPEKGNQYIVLVE
jgi:MinD-like ATPase involved in chromosome partitioning or flagellar assembly